ncbi:MAG: SdrD B-like domain-containing protein [Tepidisphaeraceae bacterium]
MLLGATVIGTVFRGAQTQFKLATAGTYVIQIRDNNVTEAGTYQIGLESISPATADAITFTKGTTQAGTISSGADTDLFKFTGAANEVVRIALADTAASPFYPEADLIAPNGAILGTVFRGTQTAFTLATAGAYLLQVHDNNFTEAGSYSIGLEGIAPISPDALAIDKGGIKSGQLSAKAEVDQYTFVGSTGDVIQIGLADTSASPFYPEVDLIAPNGTFVDTTFRGTTGRFTLSLSGTYILQVRDNNLTETGNYTVGLETLKSPSPDALWIVPGTQRSGSIATPAEIDQYSFLADASDTVRVTLADTASSPYYPEGDLFGPAGQYIGTFFRGTTQSFTLPAKGRYTLQFRDNNLTETGNYNFTVSWINPLDGSITGNVFSDQNSNGSRDSAEPGIAGRTVFLDLNNNGSPDGSDLTCVTDQLGNYGFYSLAAQTYVVRDAIPAGRALTKPTGGSYSVALALGQNATGRDFGEAQNLAVVSISATDPSAGEPSDNGAYRISRTGATTAALVVNLGVIGTAIRSTDYDLKVGANVLLTNAVTIPAGASFVDVTLAVKDDTAAEAAETALVTLAAGTGYAVGTPASASVSIADNDVASTVSITATDASAAEPADAGTYRITRTGATTAALSVNVTIAGTATRSSDYDLKVGSTVLSGNVVTIPAGASYVDVTLATKDDTALEAAETGIMTLAAGTGYAVGSPASATITIADNDSFATLLNGVLTVNGTANGDVISLAISGANLVAKLGTQSLTFSTTAIKSIAVNGLGGDDRVTLGTSVTTSTRTAVVHGNSGNDVLVGGAGVESLFGDTGNDVLIGGGSNDSLDGGDGDDLIVAVDGGLDRINGGLGTDQLQRDAADTVVAGVEDILA